MTKTKKFTVFFCALIAVIAVIVTAWLPVAPQDLILRFHPYVGDKPLILNQQTYKNPGGSGDFSIRDFQLFISNVVLDYAASNIKERESYHLVRFDANTHYDQIVIPEIKVQALKKISFGIGLDQKANGTIMIAGDLDPNSRMAWNWEVGYKFLLLEGMLTIEDVQTPLVYHIGFDESYTELNFNLSNKERTKDGVINFKVDLLRLFQKPNIAAENLTNQPSNIDVSNIDMAKMSHVKFAPDDVKVIAKGFQHFISLL